MLTIPRPQPTEHVSSYFARLTRVNGIYHARQLSAVSLLPKYKLGLSLSQFAGLSIEDLARKHTCLPFLKAIYPDRTRDGAVNARPLFSQHFFSRHAFRLPKDYPRFCRLCLLEDMDWHGYSFWRTTHQLPLITKCHKHEHELTAAIVDPTLVIPSDLLKTSYKDALFPCPSDEGFQQANQYQALAVDLLDLKYPVPRTLISARLTQLACNIGFRDILTDHYPRSQFRLHLLERVPFPFNVDRNKTFDSLRYTGHRAFSLYADARDQMMGAVSGTRINTAAACLASLTLSNNPDSAAALLRCDQNYAPNISGAALALGYS